MYTIITLVLGFTQSSMYDLVDNSVAIYQFTLILIFATALIFFVAMYWYSTSLSQTIIEREQTRQSLKINTLELQRSQLQNEMLEAEKSAREERNLRLQQAIALKNQELVSSTMLLNEQSRLMTEVGNLVKKIDGEKDPSRFNKLQRIIHSHNSFELQWENFRVHFEKVYPAFLKQLEAKHPKLTLNHVRHCAYIRMNLSTKEIAQLFGINPTSVQISRVRLKKKLGLPSEQDLREYIVEF